MRVSEQRAMEDADSFQKRQELVARIVYLRNDSDVTRSLVLYTALWKVCCAKFNTSADPDAIANPGIIAGAVTVRQRCFQGSGARNSEFCGRLCKFVPGVVTLLALRLQLHVAATAVSIGKHGW